MEKQGNLESVLKPFYQRASEVEDRISKLEAAVSTEEGAATDEHLKRINKLELELMLKNTVSDLNSERKKAKSSHWRTKSSNIGSLILFGE